MTTTFANATADQKAARVAADRDRLAKLSTELRTSDSYVNSAWTTGALHMLVIDAPTFS